MKVLVYHPAAQAELEAEVTHCERERSGAGSRVRADVEEALRVLQSFPMSGRPNPDGTRRFITNRYHYVIRYELVAEQIVIWAIAVPERDPNYWRKRRSP